MHKVNRSSIVQIQDLVGPNVGPRIGPMFTATASIAGEGTVGSNIGRIVFAKAARLARRTLTGLIPKVIFRRATGPSIDTKHERKFLAIVVLCHFNFTGSANVMLYILRIFTADRLRRVGTIAHGALRVVILTLNTGTMVSEQDV